MTKETKQLIKRYAISSAVSFSTGFAIVLLGEIDDITLQTIKDGTWIGIVFLAARAGLKSLLESFIAWRSAKS